VVEYVIGITLGVVAGWFIRSGTLKGVIQKAYEMFEAFIKEHIVDHEHTQRSGLRTGEADAGSNQVEPTQASTQAATEIIRSIEVDIQRGPKV
jgi:hypothetical protein